MVEIKAQEVQNPIFTQNVPIVYSNGFIANVGSADVSIIMLVDGTPAIKLHMSYTAAKTLNDILNNAVGVLEKATDHKIMKSDEVEIGLRKLGEEKA